MSTVLRIPAATSAFYQMLKVAEQLGRAGVTVLDGPSPTDTGDAGIAVGASAENPSGEFLFPRSDIASSGGQRFTLSCIAWARSGEAVWESTRNRCADIVRLAGEALAHDRTLGGTVSSAYIAGGIFDQKVEIRGTVPGILVTIEFRIEADLF